MDNLNFLDIFNKLQDEIKNQEPVNIMVVGKTGVGKSTLINNVFREPIAKVGIGKPVTKRLKKIVKEGMPVNIYDTKGLELNPYIQKEIKDEIIELLSKEKRVDVCWYCMSGSQSRLEKEEVELIETLAEYAPVIIVITMAYIKYQVEEFKRLIDSKNLNCVNIIPVLAESYGDEDEGKIFQPFGLDLLIEVTSEIIPQEYQIALINAEKISIDLKVKEARKVVYKYCGGSGVIGASPIPFSDAPLLVADQVAMIAKITNVFGLSLDKALMMTIISSAAGTTGTTFAGKTLVTNMLKMIPGVGTVAGGVIGGGVAASLTFSLGLAYIKVCEFIVKEETKGNRVEDDQIIEKMQDAFKKELKIKFNTGG